MASIRIDARAGRSAPGDGSSNGLIAERSSETSVASAVEGTRQVQANTIDARVVGAFVDVQFTTSSSVASGASASTSGGIGVVSAGSTVGARGSGTIISDLVALLATVAGTALTLVRS